MSTLLMEGARSFTLLKIVLILRSETTKDEAREHKQLCELILSDSEGP